MFKSSYRLLIVLILVFMCIISFSIFVIELKTDFGCFHIFDPSLSQVGKRININLPSNTANVEWRCQSGIIEGDEIYLRFTMASSDMKQFIENNSGYYKWDFGQPNFFFHLFEDHPANEEDLNIYNTFQGNSSCGWTNILIDMDNPEIYTLYADYRDCVVDM